MNSSSVCHEIEGISGVFVDAFRGSFLAKTRDASNAFLLTHYHADHYGSLPRDNKYQGPARIHCTPVTAKLLVRVHGVPSDLVVAHSYGDTWELHGANLTLYDANHCPGAAIVVVQVLHTGEYHVHCGDMRYCAAMKTYPLLLQAATTQQTQCVYLDTTYANPKHDFATQETAIDSIACQVEQILAEQKQSCINDNNKITNSDTLILLQCYSIGKEKVLWEVSERTHQRVHVSDRKLKMLECIQGGNHSSARIAERCTLNPNDTCIHVVPMSSTTWPYFQPNYQACADYANNLSHKYANVVAFIPTGWADASNWNKKHAVSRATRNGVHVEIRLVAYSEHSAYGELQEFVAFLKPRRIIPTVFKDAKDARDIQARFAVDTTRAKRHFLDSMWQRSTKLCDGNVVLAVASKKKQKPNYNQDDICLVEYDSSLLVAMGFSLIEANDALQECSGNVQAAVDYILSHKVSAKSIKETPNQVKKFIQTNSPASKVCSTPPVKSPRMITDFFSKKKST
jgi:hypothetical protein